MSLTPDEQAALERVRKSRRDLSTGEYQSGAYWQAVWAVVDIALREHPADKVSEPEWSTTRMIKAAPLMFAALLRQHENIQRWLYTDEAAGPEESREIAEQIENAIKAASNQDTPDPQDDSGSRSPICSPAFGTLTVAACECLTWGRDTKASILHLEHHPNCDDYAPEPPIRELLLRMIDGIEEWASDEDGIHEACWNAYKDACCVVGQYDRPSKQEPA